ncbi:FAD-linked oxidase [Streptomyces sp. CB02923]|uniref:FAD-binding oxidoreductase n=1 Tax=Streptomyces sp. CB02923 TaxID=1718985 RepID=UPI00093DAF6A|nr:FAD-binding protein [Streptomyces sp. CB02923]OKI01270.1 FAD-linked oxidase [Streptomyces sp. CB02923]
MPDSTGAPAAPTTITADDPRYPNLVESYNHRFVGRPEAIRFARSTAEVVSVVESAVAAGRRIAVRSGGHCFEDFTSSPEVRVLLDLSPMNAVGFDERMRAFSVEAGATLGDVYRALYTFWGVTVPGGTCFGVGAGGHFSAGGYGHLSRRDGLIVDHLCAVEVVVVDASGRARTVVATRDADDPHRGLWWAHTGGGGGSFGVVTRYWLRTPDRDPDGAPSSLLPAAPTRMRRRVVMWPWDGMTKRSFTALLRNYCGWYEDHTRPDSPAANLWNNLIVPHRSAQTFGMTAVLDDDTPGSAALLDEQFDRITDGVGVAPVTDELDVVPWWSSWMPSYDWPSDPHGRYKNKAGYLRRGFTERQLDVLHRFLGEQDCPTPAGCLVLTGFGGRVNTVPSGATATAQRDSILKASYSTGVWRSAEQDAANIAWVRAFYREMYADTGGVPVPGGTADGSYIGYPDVDLADPAWNTSGVPWHDLYFKDNYPRLQAVKLRYDPRDVFRHALSVRLPA